MTSIIHPILKEQLKHCGITADNASEQFDVLTRVISDAYARMDAARVVTVIDDETVPGNLCHNESDLEIQNRLLADTKKALLNVLEDTQETEKKLENEAEELLKFRLVAETSFDHIVITDIEGIIIFANRAAERNTGYSFAEMKGKTPRLWGGQMDPAFYEKLWKVIKQDKESLAVEMTNKRKNGETYLVEARISPILNASGEVRFFVGLERDITVRRQTELDLLERGRKLVIAKDSLEAEKKKTESILNFLRSIGDGVFATDTSGNIIFMNEMAELLSGISFSDAQGKYYKDVFHFVFEGNPEESYPNFVEKVIETRAKEEIVEHTLLISAHDKKTTIANDASPILDENQALVGCVVVLQDITRERSLEQMKDSFLSVAAHQLRTPLGSMRWNLEMLLAGDIGDLPESQHEVVQNVYENIHRLVALVNDLLNVSRIDQGATIETSSAVNVLSVIQSGVKTLTPEAQSRNISIAIHVAEEDESLRALVPQKNFYESIQNLLSNAIKYNRPGGEIHFSIQKIGNRVRITLSDTGIGIPKEGYPLVFSKFFRADNAVLTETEGTGLGLFVVKSFIEESGGKIWFESEVDKGTTFFIELPLG